MVAAELDVSARRSRMSGESGVSGSGSGSSSGSGGGGGGGGGGDKWYPGKLLGQAARSTASVIKTRTGSFGRRGRKGEATEAERREAERYAAQL